jgi:hypothetical protein
MNPPCLIPEPRKEARPGFRRDAIKDEPRAQRKVIIGFELRLLPLKSAMHGCIESIIKRKWMPENPHELNHLGKSCRQTLADAQKMEIQAGCGSLESKREEKEH